MITREHSGILPRSDFELAELVEKGLPTESLAMLKDKGLTSAEIGKLVISPRTLKHRKARGENLSAVETDRVLRVNRVLTHAEETFGNRAKALGWLRMPDDRMGDRTALSLLASEAGARVVDGMLIQIDEGMYT